MMKTQLAGQAVLTGELDERIRINETFYNKVIEKGGLR